MKTIKLLFALFLSISSTTNLYSNNELVSQYSVSNEYSCSTVELILTSKEFFVLIQWSDPRGSSIREYVIERSYDGSVWEVIGKVEGDEQSPEQFSFTDIPCGNRTKYYRIRFIDSDNRISYSATRMVNTGSANLTKYHSYRRK